MTYKKLLSQTIIPDHLYVYRSADRQLEETIKTMGRPGYILVARQMGKTNLLINTKKRLEDENNIYMYFDLSSTYETSRDCFRSIIDKTIEVNHARFQALLPAISKIREAGMAAHNEHTRELRLILGSNPNLSLILILDEIDALTKTQYSDEIFSQIRSVYFERVNYAEYNRLTYVLSGVAEPTEIIKNQKISPFNIGEKIFLNDFTYEEYAEFLEKASLGLSKHIADRIFFWTNGNPRMTWDLCSKIEDLKSDISALTIEDVDAATREKYVDSFDMAPIDHIRELVANDANIRNAIIEIKYGKGTTISQEIRRKLYLSGIVSSESLASNVTIKNRIIEESLSDKWLEEISRKSIDYLVLANADFEDAKYYSAYYNFKEHLKNNSFKESVQDLYYLKFAHCCLFTNNFEEAIVNYQLAEIDKKSYLELYLDKLNSLGLCYLYTSEYDRGEEIFREILGYNKMNLRYMDSKINLITLLKFKYKDDQLQLLREFGEETLQELLIFETELNENLFNGLLANLYFNLGEIYERLGSIDLAEKTYNQSLSVAQLYCKPVIQFHIINLSKERDATDLVNLIISNQLKSIPFDATNPLKLTGPYLSRICAVLYDRDKFLFNQLINYIRCDLYANGITVNRLKLDLALFIVENPIIPRNIAIDILVELISESRQTNEEDDFSIDVLKELAYLNTKVGSFDTSFINRIKMHDSFTLDKKSLLVLGKNILHLINSKRLNQAIELCNFLSRFYDKVDDEFKINFLLLHYYRILIYKALKNKPEILRASNFILHLVDLFKEFKSTVLADREINLIKELAHDSLRRFTISTIKVDNKINRNAYVTVVYENGLEMYKKYKHLEEDLQKGVCKIK